MVIIFARHGETILGAGGRFEGVADSQLTEKGRGQASKLAGFLRSKTVSELFVSPRGRALQTAHIISSVIKSKIIIQHTIAEICYGSWEEMRREDLVAAPEWKTREKDLLHFIHPGKYHNSIGESYSILPARLAPFLQQLESFRGDAALIAHQGVLRSILMYYSGNDEKKFGAYRFPNSVVLLVDRKSQKNIELYDFVENRSISLP